MGASAIGAYLDLFGYARCLGMVSVDPTWSRHVGRTEHGSHLTGTFERARQVTTMLEPATGNTVAGLMPPLTTNLRPVTEAGSIRTYRGFGPACQGNSGRIITPSDSSSAPRGKLIYDWLVGIMGCGESSCPGVGAA